MCLVRFVRMTINNYFFLQKVNLGPAEATNGLAGLDQVPSVSDSNHLASIAKRLEEKYVSYTYYQK